MIIFSFSQNFIFFSFFRPCPASPVQGPLLLPSASRRREEAQVCARLHCGRQLVRHLLGHRQEGRLRDPRADRQDHSPPPGSQAGLQDQEALQPDQGGQRDPVRHQEAAPAQGGEGAEETQVQGKNCFVGVFVSFRLLSPAMHVYIR